MMLMRRPGNGLYCRGVFGEAVQWCLVQFIPHNEFVVISTRCKLTVLCVPFQPADFLLVS